MGTVSGPFLIIRNLSVLFDDDTFAFPPPPREEDLLDTMIFLNRADSPLDKAARADFEDIEAAEDDAVLNMTICFSLSVYFSLLLILFFFFFFSLSLSLSRELSHFLSLSLSLLLFRSCLPMPERAIGGAFLPSLFCSRVAFCKESSIPFPEFFLRKIWVMFYQFRVLKNEHNNYIVLNSFLETICRSYHEKSIASHQHSEIKPHWAPIVLRLVIT